ncbi:MULTISPECIES: fimbrial protein [Lelliottia]|uniref:Fimbrial protein n=1 Tax=Lelliottia wanjuensis TaxID=3050585 RepID=A0AAP4D5J0_9ENTR|nr:MULTISPECIES: fimbrial protein [unclassified Lelliottia]MDK9357489.1 fimbrial protein [Lelliottia sp. V106_16]MDK9364560.1 fimbrial protein [Lelliottia sp. V106_12]MDK9373019.1 fimbrial protein [Lelliottia sp. V106_10]MDK9586444.1 fimbrial protein [Lelliottia sp. V86_10]MDK9599823.1 fimbrial protein [Lelliottia sp. V106_5]
MMEISMKYIKLVFLLFIGVFLLPGYSFASYSCSPLSGSISVNLNTITVQRDTAVGTLLATITGPNASAYSCYVSNPSSGTTLVLGVQSILGYYGHMDGISVYRTNVPGIGIGIGGAGSMNGFNYTTYVGDGTSSWYGSDWNSVVVTATYDSKTISSYISPIIKVYKIDDASSGVISGQVGAVIMGMSNGFNTSYVSSWAQDIPLMVTGTINVVACSIKTPTLNFPIGDVLASKFGSTVGTTPSDAQNTQNLGLDCDPQANINVSLSGTQNPDVGTTSVLALTGQGDAGVAQGVGVQIVYNGSPLTLNNRIVLKKSAGGQETFPLTARYYQTRTSVTTGTANTSATLNLTYQ